jgi:hypothetical protein
MKRALRFVIATAVASLIGCSKEALTRTGYETLHNISDSKNDIDPRYEPDLPAFDDYQRQREEILREQRPDEGAMPVPSRPAEP